MAHWKPRTPAPAPVVAFLVLAVCALRAPDPAAGATTANVPAAKLPVVGSYEGGGGRAPGEDIATAIPIAALPFVAEGTTAGRANDYDAACPYPGSTAPDVVYAFAPETDVNVTVSLCESSYDTKVYIFRDGPGALVACNDDAECGSTGWQSMLDHVDLAGGHTYYIVVDGYGTSAGAYRIAVLENGPCVLDTPARLIVEAEPPCRDGWDDTWNGGCNVSPYAFQDIAPSDTTITIRGTSGTYVTGGAGYRDTDWFRLDVVQENTITVRGRAEFPLLMWVLRRGAGDGCDDLVHLVRATGTVCGVATATVTVGPGEHWLWVGPSVYTGVPCGRGYVVTIDGYKAPSPVRVASWGTIKVIYR